MFQAYTAFRLIQESGAGHSGSIIPIAGFAIAGSPSRALFNRAERSFSSGCIHVEESFSLATLLLDDAQKRNETKIEARLASAKNETVRLNNPITVFLMCWTSEPDGQGDAHFYNDVYSRDHDVLKGLQQPFRFIPIR